MSQLGNLEAGSRHDLRVGVRPMRRMKLTSEDAKAPSATCIRTRRRRDMTGPACASCCSCRVVCFAAPIATTPIPGI